MPDSCAPVFCTGINVCSAHLNEYCAADLGASTEGPRRLATKTCLGAKQPASQVASQTQTPTHTDFSGKRQKSQTQGEE